MAANRRIIGWGIWGGLVGLGISLICGAAQGVGGESPAKTASTQPASVDNAVIITVKDEITDITFDSIERRLKSVGEENLDMVIFELDTPGGVLGTTLEICDKIKSLRDKGIATYAWVNNEAYSAGTIMALATDGIIMASRATIGDCQPIMITGMGATAIPESIEAKATSPLLAELRDSTRRNKYNWHMILSLIRPEMQIFWLVNTTTGQKRFVTQRGRDELFGLSEFDRDEDEDDEEGKKKKKKRRSRSEPIPDSESKTDWEYVKKDPVIDGEIIQPIVSDRDLLTMKTDEAVAYGFCIATLDNERELVQHFKIGGTITRVENTWLETAIEWLASPSVRAILFLLMMLGAYAEFQSPGLGVPGAVALVALVLFLGAPYLAGYTVTWEIGAIVLGIILLAVEMFVIPGFGVAGITGIILLMVGLLASFVPEEPGFEEDWFRLPSLPATYTYLKHGLYSIAGGLIASVIGMVMVAKYFPKVPVAGRIIAPNPTREQITIDDPYQGMADVGAVGESAGPLRPAGTARFGGIMVDVVTRGDYIEAGIKVEVVERHGNRVVVRKVD
ncbi:MAG: NfeD family protein [Planctomycetota bacterium]|jgi:membrane-bound serine protease (ClpP class)